MSAARSWIRLHFFLLTFGALWFGLAAWALQVPFFLLAAALCVVGAVRRRAGAFGPGGSATRRWHPAWLTVFTAIALGVGVAGLAPALWRWLH